MRYLCLACDYDGTLAREGKVSRATIRALKRVAQSGRKLVLVTGREVRDLLRIFPDMKIFDRVAAENGAVLYSPASKEERLLASPPKPEFVAELRRLGVAPLDVGKIIVATERAWELATVEVIRRMRLPLQIIFNKDSVMVLPAAVDKATGLEAALRALELSPENTVGVGDAENDQAFLAACGCGVAVANALPALKEQADYVTKGSDGSGVEELIEKLLENDLAEIAPRHQRAPV